LIVSPLLHEIYSPFDGQPLAHIVSRDWDVYTGLPSEYERPQDIFVRTRKFVMEVRQKYAGQQIVAVSHGDVIAFTILGILGLPVTAQQSRMDFRTLGFSDHYPVRASIVTFTFLTNAQDEIPEIEYVNPHGGL
jgi:broad specificity phosphatase PhoE